MAASRSTKGLTGATGIRLQKILSQAGVSSRREGEALIQQGRVEVNGAIVTQLGTRADPVVDDVRVDGRKVGAAPERRYLLMNKPRGVVSTRKDPHRRPTVVGLLERVGVTGYFYPVGRLDFESEGLIILTNDGAFAQRVTHPRYEMERGYEAQVLGVPDAKDLTRLRRGIVIDGRRTLPARVRVKRIAKARSGPQAVLELILREGRNRQVRYMCDAIAHPVERLRRTRIAHIEDAGLKPGQIRDLTAQEVASLLKRSASTRVKTPAAKRRATKRPVTPKPMATGSKAKRSTKKTRPTTKKSAPSTGSHAPRSRSARAPKRPRS